MSPWNHPCACARERSSGRRRGEGERESVCACVVGSPVHSDPRALSRPRRLPAQPRCRIRLQLSCNMQVRFPAGKMLSVKRSKRAIQHVRPRTLAVHVAAAMSCRVRKPDRAQRMPTDELRGWRAGRQVHYKGAHYMLHGVNGGSGPARSQMCPPPARAHSRE